MISLIFEFFTWIKHQTCQSQIAARDEAAKTPMETFAQQHGGWLDDYFYLPLRGKNRDIVLALSAQDGMPAGWIPISPWLEDYRNAR